MVALSIASRRTSLSGYFQRISVRERGLIVVVVLIVLFLAPLKAYDWSQSVLSTLFNDKATLQAAQQQDNTVQLHRLAHQLAEQGRQVRAWSWTAQSFAVARVLLEQEVATAAVKAGVTNPDVKSAEEPDVIGPAQFVRVELSCPFTWAEFPGLIQGLTAQGKGYVIDSASLQQDPGGARLRLVVLMPFITVRRGPTH